MMYWNKIHPRATEDMLGIIPAFLDDNDPRPAAEQFNEHYAPGGGWMPFEGFTMLSNEDLSYPEDPPTKLLWKAAFRDEDILVYEHAWVGIKQADGSFEISRMD